VRYHSACQLGLRIAIIQSRNLLIRDGNSSSSIFRMRCRGLPFYDLVALTRDFVREPLCGDGDGTDRRHTPSACIEIRTRCGANTILVTVQRKLKGRGSLRLHRLREGESKLPSVHPDVAGLRAPKP